MGIHLLRQWLFVNYKLLTARQMLIPLIEESEARETRCIWVADGFISSPDVCLAGGTVGSTKCEGISSDVSNIHCGSMLSDLKLWPTHWLPLCQGEVDHTSYDCVVQACATGSRRGPCFETSWFRIDLMGGFVWVSRWRIAFALLGSDLKLWFLDVVTPKTPPRSSPTGIQQHTWW